MNPQEYKNMFLEKVAEHACKYFSEKLPKKGKPCTDKFEWTTMAAIVQCVDKENFKVVSLGTGTKCLGKNELSPLGDVLSDSHAEVICRRSFLLYLYDQLFLTLSNKESIFEMKKLDGFQTFFNLRPSITFHLFISHVPCGDAAIFDTSVNNDSADSETNEPPTKKSRNTDDNQEGNNGHRTGAKLNVGDTTYEDVQTVGKCRVKPGKGDPTLSMSCSDKIAKWQIMGLQGSLLGNFIKNPIILQSVIIGGSVPFEYASVKRALHDRFFGSKDEQLLDIFLQSPFKKQSSPEIYKSCINFMNCSVAGDHVPKPAPASISNYFKYDINSVYVEVSVNGRKQGATKKCFGKPVAQVAICRRKLFQSFCNLCNKYEEAFKTFIMPISSSTTYREAKAVNSVYSETWSSLKNCVMIGWTAKPDNLKDFSL